MMGIASNNLFLAKVEENNLQQIYEWKNDLSLLDLVKSHSVLSNFDDVKDWYHRNTHDKNQVLLSINTLDNKIIGIARLMFIDWISRTTELGIYLGSNEYTGKSYGTE